MSQVPSSLGNTTMDSSLSKVQTMSPQLLDKFYFINVLLGLGISQFNRTFSSALVSEFNSWVFSLNLLVNIYWKIYICPFFCRQWVCLKVSRMFFSWKCVLPRADLKDMGYVTQHVYASAPFAALALLMTTTFHFFRPTPNSITSLKSFPIAIFSTFLFSKLFIRASQQVQ